MALRSRTRYLNLTIEEESFIWKFIGKGQESYNLEDVTLLRRLLSKERAKVLFIIKTKKPSSIYQLAKLLSRDIKAVEKDLKLLEKFGFIEFYRNKKGKRDSKTPKLAVDQLNIIVTL